MRLHRLDLTAFGPFAGHESVDFDELASSGLFLLNGPTGSGKTSILDAVAYALYGKVPGARGDQTGDLRSHLADDDVLTEVILEATIRGRRIRVTRQPQQVRPKRRGDGTTDQPATATLSERRDGTWTGIAGKPGEVTKELQDLIGLDADQFQQVILLPQGEFARFLRADARDRQELLEAVFDTNRFGAITRWLLDEAKRLGSTLSGIDTQLGATFIECAGTLEVEPPEATDDARRQWLEQHAATLDAARQSAITTRDEEDQRLTDATDYRAAVSALNGLQQRHQQALADRKTIADELARLPALRTQLDAALRAEPISVILGQRSDARTEGEQLAPQLVEHAEHLGAICPDLTDANQAKISEAETDVSGSLVSLRQLAGKEQHDLPLHEVAVVRAGGELSRLDKQVADLDSKITGRNEALAEDRNAVLDGVKARELLVPTTTAAAAAKSQFETAEQRASVQQEFEEQIARLPAVQEQAERAHARYQQLLQRRIAGISAELADSLTSGDPCPVCGSTEHPQPAVPTDDHVSEEALNEALGAQRKADDAVATLLGAIETAQKRIDAMTEAIGTDSFEEFRRRHNAADDEVTAIAARIKLADAAGERVNSAEESIAGLLSQREDLLTRRPALESNQRLAVSNLDSLSAELSAAAQPFDTVAERVTALEQEHAAIAAVLQTTTRLASLETQIADLTRQAEERATATGFATLTDAEQARLPDDERRALDQRIKDLERQDATIAATLDDEEVIAAAAKPPADIPGAEANFETARQRAREASDHVTKLETKCQSLERCRASFDKALTEGGPLRQQYDTVRTLSRLANGEAGVTQAVRMSLVNYVLSAQLQRVADAANTRLHTMTNGRYTLLQTDEARSGHAMGGLGIEVHDLHSTKTRGTRSLSGGESFMASLALALGLADVVAAEAGGVSLETLFIDEGFGTLDGEALNAVLDILDGLRTGGRTVGVVSHVSEMKERIPTHLIVEQVNRISRIVQTTSST